MELTGLGITVALAAIAWVLFGIRDELHRFNDDCAKDCEKEVEDV